MRRLARNALQLFALWGIAVAQPLLSVLGSSTDSFIVHGLEPHDLILFCLALAALPPLGMLLLEAAVSRWSRVLASLHVLLVAALAALVALHLAKSLLGLEQGVQLAASALATLAAIALLHRFAPVDLWLRLLAVMPLVAVFQFLFDSSAGRYARAASVAAYEVESGTTPVVFVMFDEFPTLSLLGADGTIDAARFPNFARLAGLSTWYRNFTSSAETTHFAVPAALSGREPDFGLASTYVDHPDTLFSWLGGSYRMNVSELVTKLCPPAICSDAAAAGGEPVASRSANWRELLRDVYSVYVQMIDTTRANEYDAFTDVLDAAPASGAPGAAGGDSVRQLLTGPRFATASELSAIVDSEAGRWRAWLDRIGRGAGPTLDYVHLLLPHQPWLYYPDGSRYASAEPETTQDESDWELRVRRQRHVLQLQYLDGLLGELLARLEATGLLDRALLVVTADHGMAFSRGYPRRFLAGDYATYAELIYAPLFVHTPGQAGGTASDENVESIDLLPLLSSLIGVPLPWQVDGMIPAAKTGLRQAQKTLYLYPNPFAMAPRTEKTFSFAASDGARELLARATGALEPGDYLSPLYAATPFTALRGASLDRFTLATCHCKAVIDTDLLTSRPLLLLRGVLSGDVASGDWLALAVGGKVSGLAHVDPRKGVLRFNGLLRREDYVDDAELPAVYRIGAGGATLELIEIVEGTGEGNPH